MDSEEAAVSVFVVERFLPRLTGTDVSEHARRETEVVAAGRADIHHLRTVYLPDDELCLSLFEAPSIEALRRVNDQAGMAWERITAAIDVETETRR